MSATVPLLEETKSVILKAKGPAWLKEQQEKFTKTYGTSVKDPAMVLWLIAKQGGLEVTEIKAGGDSGEGQSVVIAEMAELARKDPSANGWTRVADNGNGGVDFIQPDSQEKYSITVAVMSLIEGVTKKGGPKLEGVITDGTAIGKFVAYADAVDLFVQAKVKPGSVIKIPLCNIQYGHHNFGKEKNMVWWKFAVPPFGEVIPQERDAKEFFLSLESDVVKSDKPCYLTGFITHIEERQVESCTICRRWVMENKPHEKCIQDEKYDVVESTVITGTATSITGQTSKLNFESKPKIKVAVDLVEVYGKMNKVNAIDVAFIRKPSGAVEAVTAPAPKVAPAAPKPAPKKVIATVQESQDIEEDVIEDAPVAVNPNKAGSDARKAALKAFKAPPVEEETDEAEEEVEEAPVTVIVKKAAPKPVVKTPSPLVSENGEIPSLILAHLEKSCKQFGGQNRIFVIARTAFQTGLVTGDEETATNQMKAYIEQAVTEGLMEFTSAQKNGVRWL